jgi:formamidopyrimidine-DNA glycosylase
VTGRRIATVSVAHPRAVRRHVAGSGDFAARLVDRVVGEPRRRGKYLWLPLDSGEALLAHLGMSGQLLVEEPSAPDETHLRVRVTFADGGRELRFVDQRTFGGLAVAPTEADGVPVPMRHIAPDPLEAAFDPTAFGAALRRRRTGIKRALLDQTLVSGVGNIYADEALWRARLHYARPTETLTRPQVAGLLTGRSRRHDGGARRRRHVLRHALRRRQRRVGLLRPFVTRLRAGRPSRAPGAARPSAATGS